MWKNFEKIRKNFEKMWKIFEKILKKRRNREKLWKFGKTLQKCEKKLGKSRLNGQMLSHNFDQSNTRRLPASVNVCRYAAS